MKNVFIFMVSILLFCSSGTMEASQTYKKFGMFLFGDIPLTINDFTESPQQVIISYF